MTRWITLIAACFISATAAAQTTSVPKEIVAFKKIDVYIVGDARKCNIKDTKKLASHLQDKLGGIGIKQDSSSLVTASLQISGGRFGVLSVLCNYSVNVGFQTWLAAENIVTKNARARAALDRLQYFPITLWQGSLFGVTTLRENMNPDAPGGEDQAQQAAMTGIDTLVKRFEDLRK